MSRSEILSSSAASIADWSSSSSRVRLSDRDGEVAYGNAAHLEKYIEGDASPNQILSKSSDAAKNTETADPVVNHLAEEGVPDREEDESVAYDTVDPLAYSSTPDPDFDSSPDVNIDGTVDRESDVGDSEQVQENDYSMLSISVLILLVVVGIAALAYFSGLM